MRAWTPEICFLRKLVPLEEEETGGSLFDKLSAAGAELLLATLTALEKGTVTPAKTGREPHGLCENAHEGAWEPSTGIGMPSAIERLIRGLNPWPSAYTHASRQDFKNLAGRGSGRR